MEKELPNPNDEITIKIQTLDSQYPITIKSQCTVSDLKDKLCELLKIPQNNLRLLYQGKQLQSSEKLKYYKIGDDSVIHLVVRSTTITSMDDFNTNTNIQIDDNNNTQSNSIPFMSLRGRNNPFRSRRHLKHYDPSEGFECLYQNIASLGYLLNCKNNFDYSKITQSRTIKPFNFNKGKFEIGQWIDVKDTIDQWLEGQIVNIRTNENNTAQVLVHYNGWGSRWDEWIDVNSKRIACFKTYTLPSSNSIFLSPYPVNNCDSSATDNLHRPIDTQYYFEKVSSVLSDIQKSLDYLGKLRKRINYGNTIKVEQNNKEKDDILEESDNIINTNSTNNKEGLSMNSFLPFSVNETEVLFNISQIIPILDRCGRLMSDLSLQLSHLILNPNLYPNLLLGRNNEISDSMSCTSDYSMYTNESASVSEFTNNFRFLQEQNIANNLRTQSNTVVSASINTPQINRQININSQNQQSQNQPSNSNNFNTTNQNINSNTNANQFSGPRYFITSSSSELPFIQRLNFANAHHNNYYNYTNTPNPFDNFPKINLQVPPLISPLEMSMINGYNPLEEQNILLFSRNVIVEQSQSPPHYSTQTNQNAHRENNNNVNINTEKHQEEKSDSEDNNTINQQKNDVRINLLSFNKDNNYIENNIESYSQKSDKSTSLKNKNLSYRSVSEVNEDDENDEPNQNDCSNVNNNTTSNNIGLNNNK